MFNNTEEFEIKEEPKYDIYTVKSVDTLWTIVSDYYGYDNDTDIVNKINELVEYNHIEDARCYDNDVIKQETITYNI